MNNIELSKIKNCRDLGGIKTEDGRTVRKGFFIRGTTLKNLNNKDIFLLKNEYKLSTIIDLRCYKEINEDPDFYIDDVDYLKMPLSTEAVLGISHEKKVHTLKTLEMMPPMEDLYVKLVSDECKDNLVKILKTIFSLTDDQYSVFFHCSVGKDRTGIVAALILSFLGVDRNSIIKDYLYTNNVVKLKAYFVYLGIFLIKWNHKFARKIMRSMLAEKEFIENALDTIENKYGSVENFFIKEIGLTKDKINYLKDKFLE